MHLLNILSLCYPLLFPARISNKRAASTPASVAVAEAFCAFCAFSASARVLNTSKTRELFLFFTLSVFPDGGSKSFGFSTCNSSERSSLSSTAFRLIPPGSTFGNPKAEPESKLTHSDSSES
ncbi:hypothetical protein AAHE18_04G246200 [Arachis hypogaea]